MKILFVIIWKMVETIQEKIEMDEATLSIRYSVSSAFIQYLSLLSLQSQVSQGSMCARMSPSCTAAHQKDTHHYGRD